MADILEQIRCFRAQLGLRNTPAWYDSFKFENDHGSLEARLDTVIDVFKASRASHNTLS